MRRIALFLTIALGLCLPARVSFAQEHQEAATEKGEKGHGGEEEGR